MTRFPDLFRLAILDTAWLLPTTCGCVLLTYLAFRYVPAARPAHLIDWASPLLAFAVPTLMLLWAAVSYGAAKDTPPGRLDWRSGVLTVAGLLHFPLLGWLTIRQRRWVYAILGLGLLSLIWLGLSWFVGAMAIVDDWV